MDSLDRVQQEEVLRSAVLAGDERAWRTWYYESFDDLYRYVRWRCGGRQDWADEIVQETWLVAVRSVQRFDPKKAAFLAWMRGIAANVLVRLGYLPRQSELAAVAGYLHDLGNGINRLDHGIAAALLSQHVLERLGMPAEVTVPLNQPQSSDTQPQARPLASP